MEKAVRAYRAELGDSHALTARRGYGYLLAKFEALLALAEIRLHRPIATNPKENPNGKEASRCSRAKV
jgi:hypothetical protein